MVLRRYDFIRRRALKERSEVAFVAGRTSSNLNNWQALFSSIRCVLESDSNAFPILLTDGTSSSTADL